MGDYQVHDGLYEARDLLGGFDQADPIGFVKTHDFKVYRRFVSDGGASPHSVDVRLQQANHDARMAGALAEFLRAHPRLVGFMGGHKVRRDERAYHEVALLGRRLAREGFLLASGGGPGAMEAAHVGAACAESSDQVLGEVLKVIQEHPTIPPLAGIVRSDGELEESRREDIEGAHKWMGAALNARALLPERISASVAIPTWLYGQEPTMPFATAYAKYFQNSIREEALVTESRAGIIYARGGGGTIREVFQDVEQNFYAGDAQEFTPMIFFDPEDYWQMDAEIDVPNRVVKRPGLKIDGLVRKAFEFSRVKHGDGEQCLKKVVFTTDFDTIVSLLNEHAPVARRHLMLMLGGI